MHRPAPSLRAVAGLLVAAALAVPAGGARAEEGPLPPTPTNFVYARSLGMAAYHASTGGNDAMFYNPAALAAQKAYTVDLSGIMFRVGDSTDGTMFGGSVVDSASTTVAGGFSYNYVTTLGYSTKGAFGGMLNFSAAFPVGDNLFIGATGTYLNLYADFGSVSATTITVSALLKFGKWFQGSFTGYNLINTYHPDVLPLGMAAGLAVGPGDTFHVLGDWKRLYGNDNVHSDQWSLGTEVFLWEIAAVRGGWMYDDGMK
ncbi:MAG TPA: hypothetical protein VFM45_09935, partial [Anaeromyxobacteraceae bacterium]|nr:hypothetical protein [Anaeromyxobacteraceae bacterium]